MRAVIACACRATGASTKESQFRVARDIANYLSDAIESRKYFGVVNADSLDMHLRTYVCVHRTIALAVVVWQARVRCLQ